MAILSVLLTSIIIIVSILLVLIVLVQRPKQEGLGAAFGGGTFDSALGAHATDIFQKITAYLAAIFFVSAIGLAMVKSRQFAASPASDVLEKVENREAQFPPIPPTATSFPADGDTGASPETVEPAAETESSEGDAPAEGNADEAPSQSEPDGVSDTDTPDGNAETTPEAAPPVTGGEADGSSPAPGPGDGAAEPAAESGKGGQ